MTQQMKANKNLIQVFEHQKLTLDTGKYPLPPSKTCLGKFDEGLWRKFEEYHEQTNTPFFKLIRNGVQFTSYVGAIRIGKTTIEVLPKADRTNQNESDQEKDNWHDVLIDMLKTCHLLTAKQSGEANLKLKANSIFELYFELFVNEIEQLLRQGLIKKYRKKEGNRTALKGALQFSKHLNRNLIHKERFYVRYTDYNKNHLLHQILKEALLVIQQLNTSSLLSDRIGRLLLDFPEVNRLKVNAKTFEKITYNRKNTPYKLALQIAELILLSLRPDIRSGARDLIAIMFDMNVLWEEYVYRVLRRYRAVGWEVSAQRSKKFWQNISARPDVVLKKGTETFIIDTKWKLVESNKPSVDDLRQIFAYNHLWGARKSILLYPAVGKEEHDFHPYSSSIFSNGDDTNECKVGFIDVLEFSEKPNGKQHFANAIFDKLKSSSKM